MMLRAPIWILLLGFAACDSSTSTGPTPSAVESVRKAAPAPPSSEAPSVSPEVPPPAGQDPSEPTPIRPELPREPEFIVKPVENEPVWPSPSDEAEVAKRKFLPFKGGYMYEIAGASGKNAGVVVDGLILLDRGIVELLGCGEGGKEYESILRLDADVQGLDLALTLCGLKRGPIPGRLADPEIMQGSRVIVLLQWEDDDGKTVTHRAEDCVVNIQRKSPMPRVGWTYVGAMLPIPDPAATPGKTYRVLAAAGTRSLLTTYRDPSTLLDNPLTDAIDDSLYVANYMVLPTSKTKVRVILRPPDDTTRKEIARLEEELSK